MGRVLDVGTGRGVMARALASKGFQVTTVDVDDSMKELSVELGRRAGFGDRIAYWTMDASSLPSPDGHFDAAFMLNALHHLDVPSPILDEMIRVTKPGGYVVLGDFDDEGFAFLDRIHKMDGPGHGHDAGTTTIEDAVRHMAVSGLNLVNSRHGHMENVRVWQKG